MKLLDLLLGRKAPPAWDIKPGPERPAPKKRAIVDEPTVEMELPNSRNEPNPFMDESLDTIQLETDRNHAAADDPYRSHSWQLDPENDTRGLKSIPIGSTTKKSSSQQFNPYDTGKHRRGWKN